MNITILMSAGSQNLGDELILKNEIKLLKDKYGQDSKFKIFTYDLNDTFFKNENTQYLEYFPLGLKNPKNIFRNIKNFFSFVNTIRKSDKVVLGGGGIIFDNETGSYSNPLNQWYFRTVVAKFFKKDVIFWGISIDIKNKENYTKVKKIFSNATQIYVRDEFSNKFLSYLGIKSEIILDPVFYDNGEIGLVNYHKNFLLEKVNANYFSLDLLEGYDFQNKTVGLALRSGYLVEEEYLIPKIIEHIIKNGGKVVLLPHSFHKIDKHANDYEFLKTFIKEGVTITKDMKETYYYYKEKKINFCFSMRLHSMILSQIYGIYFVGIKYSKKGDLM